MTIHCADDQLDQVRTTAKPHPKVLSMHSVSGTGGRNSQIKLTFIAFVSNGVKPYQPKQARHLPNALTLREAVQLEGR
jgi:hypothetical protein